MSVDKGPVATSLAAWELGNKHGSRVVSCSNHTEHPYAAAVLTISVSFLLTGCQEATLATRSATLQCAFWVALQYSGPCPQNVMLWSAMPDTSTRGVR